VEKRNPGAWRRETQEGGEEKPRSADRSKLRVNKSVCATRNTEKRDPGEEFDTEGTEGPQRERREG